jgi:prepilin-type processing-associated H-X9-DG protein
LPPALLYFAANDKRNSKWSALARLLPYLEEESFESNINYSSDYETAQFGGGPIGAYRVATYLCPTEERDEVRLKNGVPIAYPTNYGVNRGVWRTFDPTGRLQDEGAFQANKGTEFRSIADGLSKTLLLAEVKGWTPYFRDSALDQAMPPANPAEVCNLGSSSFQSETGHTEWVDGRAHQTGFTAVFTPNTGVPCPQSGQTYDVDWTAQREGTTDTGITYSAVTSRSYHAGGVVNVAMVDGSIHTFTSDIELPVWRAMATRGGEEAVGD